MASIGIALLFVFFTIVMRSLFKKLGWTVQNFEGKIIPYSLGAGLVLVTMYTTSVFSLSIAYSLYIGVIWFVGLIDDIYGVSDPKGLKGHFGLFFQKGKMTTGLLKVLTTGIAALLMLIFLQPSGFSEIVSFFVLLLLAPHVMNLFDTRPLRVWKVTILHVSLFIPLLLSLPFDYVIFIGIALTVLYIVEGRKSAMLGDNGATAIGALLSLLVITNVETLYQWLLICIYVVLTIAAEKISFTRWIEETPWMKRIDRWGTS